MKGWKRALLIGALSAAAAFAVATIALGATGADRGPPSGFAGDLVMTAVGRDPSGQAWCGRGGGSLTDPQAREEMRTLRDEHRAEMREWWEKYGDDPSADEARSALEQLRAHHADEMRDLFEKYGLEPPAGLGEGRTAGCGLGRAGAATGLGGCGGAGWYGGSGMMGGASSAGADSL